MLKASLQSKRIEESGEKSKFSQKTDTKNASAHFPYSAYRNIFITHD
jgi:hypothetical protein